MIWILLKCWESRILIDWLLSFFLDLQIIEAGKSGSWKWKEKFELKHHFFLRRCFKYCRWYLGLLKHWIVIMAQTSPQYQSTLNQHMGICPLGTHLCSHTIWTWWKPVGNLCFGRTTTWRGIPQHLPGEDGAGLQNRRVLCHQILLYPCQSREAARRRTPMHLQNHQRQCRWRYLLGLENQEDGQGNSLSQQPRQLRQHQAGGPEVDLLRWRLHWLKLAFNNRLLQCSVNW